MLTTDDDDGMDSSSPTDSRPIVTTTAAATASHLLSFDADESIISHASDFIPSHTIITSHHATDFTAGGNGRMPPLVTPRISQHHQQQHKQNQQQGSSPPEVGGPFSMGLGRPMNPHSSNFSIQSSSCGDDQSSRTPPPSFIKKRNTTATVEAPTPSSIEQNKAIKQRDETIHRLTLEIDQWKQQHQSLSNMQREQQQLAENIHRCNKELEDNTNHSEELMELINTRKEELSSLQDDVKFAKTEKDQLALEYEKKSQSLEKMSSRFREVCADLDRVREERDVAAQTLEKTKVDCENLTREAQSRIQECHAREEELKVQVAHTELLARELSSDRKQLQHDREVLDKEREELSNKGDQMQEQSDQQEDNGQKEYNGQYNSRCHLNQISMPMKLINAMPMSPVMINVMPKPFNGAGT